jgi:hypothetical protein
MKYPICLLGLLVCLGLVLPYSQVVAGQSIGGGIHYHKTLGEIRELDVFDDVSTSWVISYQRDLTTLLRLEVDLEIVEDYGGSDSSFYLPQVYVLLGTGIYGGVGIGLGQLDGEWSDDPFYALQVGVKFPIFLLLNLEIKANYRVMDASVLDDFEEEDADAITFGAALRLDL